MALATLVAALALATAAPSHPASGLYGLVTRGPIAPVCRQDEPCEAPAEVTLVFVRPGHAATRIRSSANGRYRATLAPGYYTVRTLERIGIARRIRPAAVHVRPGHVDRIDFAIDTGIR
jgi:hypothetical protein